MRDTISQLQLDDAVLSYYQLYGFLFALACAPESIRPTEWFELIWLDDEPQFDREEDATRFYKMVIALAEHISQLTNQHRFLPFSVNYSDRWQEELAQWCEGMLMGHMYLEDLWYIALEDIEAPSLTEDVETVLNLASTFADLEDAKQLSFEGGMALTDEHLPEAYELFWKALAAYACVGSLWSDVKYEVDAEQLFLALGPVPRNSMCPCGSGLIFSKCCLH